MIRSSRSQVRDLELSDDELDDDDDDACDDDDDRVGELPSSSSSKASPVAALVDEMLRDEAVLNEALESCRYDYSHRAQFAALRCVRGANVGGG